MTKLNPDIFVCHTAQPSIRAARVEAASLGRPSLTDEQLRTQSMLQETLVTSYSAATGIPAYFMRNETEEDLDKIKAELFALIGGKD